MKRIGIMGGTFDPVHNGHLLLGKQAYEEYHLDEIWYMPSHIPPHKKDHQITAGTDRIEMLKLALKGQPYCIVSDFEMKREGNTYTAQTLELLKKEAPDDQFYFIIGADSLFQIENWYHPEKVMALTSFLVSGREYPNAERTLEEQIVYLTKTYGARIHLLHNEELLAASADIRRRIAEGDSVSDLIPETVEQYIRTHGLYTAE